MNTDLIILLCIPYIEDNGVFFRLVCKYWDSCYTYYYKNKNE